MSTSQGPVATNFLAFRRPGDSRSRIGRLNFEKQEITPLSYTSGTPLQTLYEVIEIGENGISSAGEPISLSSVQLLPPISGRDVLAVGKNYVDHAKEFNKSGYDSSDKNDQPTHPVIFTKRVTSIIAHGNNIFPHLGFTESLDYEGEIGVIIGKPGFNIREEDAMNHVWGYTIINDVTARERQRDHKQFYIGKSPDTFCPIGPVAVPKEHLPEVLKLQTFVNGEKRQEATTKDLIFSIPHLVATLSAGQTLQIGDTLATGTPAGVGIGFDPKKWLKPGDEISVSVTGLGTLTNQVASLTAQNPVVSQVLSQSYIPIVNDKTPGGAGLTRVGKKRLFYQVRGNSSGPPVLCVHGLGGTADYFSPLVSKLGKSHAFHVLDLEGHGLSPTSAASLLTVESFAEDVIQLAKEHIVTPFTLVAHSMGSLVALTIALTHPEMVKDLVLMGPPPSPLPEAASRGTYARAAKVREAGLLGIVDEVVNGGNSAHTHAHNPVAIAAARLSILSQDPESYAKACGAIALSAKKTLDVSQLRCPTLLITGVEDRVSPPALCEKYSNIIPRSKLLILNDVAHWHLFEDLERVSSAIADFLAGH